MAKKPERSAAASAALPATGGSYVADEAAGFTRVDGPAAAPLRPRRGFDEPVAGATPTPTEPPKE